MQDDLETIRATYCAYFEAFQTKDASAILQHFHVPCMIIDAGGVSTLLTREDVAGRFGRMLEALAKRGYERSEIHELHVKQLSDDVAMVSLHGARYDHAGGLLQGVGAVYTMKKLETGWKIAFMVVHDPAVIVALNG